MVGTVVGCELIRPAIKREAPVADAVAVPAYHRPEVGVRGQVSLETVETERDISDRAAPIGHADRRDDGAIGHGPHFDAVPVCERVDLDRSAGRGAEWLPRHAWLLCVHGPRLR